MVRVANIDPFKYHRIMKFVPILYHRITGPYVVVCKISSHKLRKWKGVSSLPPTGGYVFKCVHLAVCLFVIMITPKEMK